MSLICVVSVLGAMLFSPSKAEEYGLAVVQFDEAGGTYFVEVLERHEISSTEETKVGMPVSYLKNEGKVCRVSSKLQTKEEMLKASERDFRLGLMIGGLICWIVGGLILLVRHFFTSCGKAYLSLF